MKTEKRMKRNRKKVAGIVMLALIGVIFFVVVFGVIFYRFYIAGIPVWGCVIAGLAPFICAAVITPLVSCAIDWITD